MATANQGARLRPFRAAGARTKSMGSQRRAGPPRGSGGRLKQPPERQSPRDAGGAEPREDTQEEEIWGLGGSGGVPSAPRVPDSSPPPTRSHCRYRRHLVPGLLLDPEPPLPVRALSHVA